ncbi:MAG: nuclear transport factor 2 family protein [Myxococcales bacterium FL481]|nr:MAG: nuclear transport factor 2 family protein [Myxococcales bacterium FL481]
MNRRIVLGCAHTVTHLRRAVRDSSPMSAHDIGKKLVAFCRDRNNLDSINTLYADNVVSVESVAPAGGQRVAEGIEAVRGKNQWWETNHEIHSSEVSDPYPHGDDKFAVRFTYDVTNKPSGQRIKMDEIGVFTVHGDKVVREEFFYTMG